jgi:hypothetical protein
MRVALLTIALPGCYLSHPSPAIDEGGPDVTLPDDPCIIDSSECEPARPVRQSETCPWSPAACRDEDEGGAWCCMTGPASRRAVDVDGECRFDTEACLAYEEMAPVRTASELVENLPDAGALVTVVGTAGAIHADAEHGADSALALDGALRLVGAPCGVSFDCEDDAHCAPVPAGSRIRVTGWVNAMLMVCALPAFDQPTLDVVSWIDEGD